jgi:hypothetical protein
MVSEEELQAADLSLRTTDPKVFLENKVRRFDGNNSPGKLSFDANHKREHLKAKRQRKKRKQRYNSEMANELLAYADAMQRPEGVLPENDKGGKIVGGLYGVFGIPTYAAKASSARAEMEFLSRLMCVFMIDEAYTSQVSLGHATAFGAANF